MKTLDTVHVTAHAGGRGTGMNAPLVELDTPIERPQGGHYTHALLITTDDVRKRFGLVLATDDVEAPRTVGEGAPTKGPREGTTLTSDSVGAPSPVTTVGDRHYVEGSLTGLEPLLDAGVDEATAKLLVENGFGDPGAVADAEDADLLAIKGLGPAKLEALREAIPANETED